MTSQIFHKKCLSCDRTYGPEMMVCEHDGTQLAAMLTKSLVGATLGGGKYELIEELGRGGMGVVFRAQHKLMERTVAIKMLIDDLSQDESALSRFHVEAKAAAALNHPHIIRVYDFDVSQHGYPYIVMDYLQGEALDSLLDSHKCLDWQRAVAMFIKVCDALGHAHRRQVVHRDIKPSNIMLIADDDDGEKPIVLDFGIAKLFTQAGNSDHRVTRTGEIFGSPLYMSPEQCMGKTVDSRADIYSLGCVMYETLTGVAPFERSGFLQVILAHINDTAKPLDTCAHGTAFPAGLTEVVARAMAKAPDDRYPTMSELKQALAALLGLAVSGPISVPPAVVSAAPDPKDSGAAPGGFDEPGDADLLGGDFEGWLRGAEDGIADNQFDVAWAYREGDNGAPQNSQKAFYWIEKAAQNGYVPAMNVLADLYSNGEGTEQNEAEALNWRKRSAETGDMYGQCSLGFMYDLGQGCDVDPDMAAYWYRQSADQGFPTAQHNLGYCYENGVGVEVDLTESFRWYMKAAEQGDSMAQRRVGEYLRLGRGTPPDPELAYYWYAQAAEQEDLSACFEQALMLFEGYGCRQDTVEAKRRLRQAAQKGSHEAQYYLGACHEWGWYDTTINLRESVLWYKKAVSQSYPDAEYTLAALYEDGRGVPQDLQEACRLFRLAAEHGHTGAMVSLSGLLREGRGCQANLIAAMDWLKEAVDLGDAWGMFKLARQIEAGAGPQDKKYDAKDLIKRSAEGNYPEAQYEYAIALIEADRREDGLEFLRMAAQAGNTDAQDALKNLRGAVD